MEVRASGAERHAWRGVFERPSGGREIHGVLIAPAEGRWRARILTYPRMLWTFPGAMATLKFVADHPQEAERSHRLHQGSLRETRTAATAAGASPGDGAFDPESRDGDAAQKRRHCLRTLPVRFGTEIPRLQAQTVDLSERGLFIATDARLPRGTRIHTQLDVGPCRMPLKGVVAWSRVDAEPGRPCGLGIEIVHPPALFLDYVRSLP